MLTFNSGNIIKAKLEAFHLETTGEEAEPFEFMSSEGTYEKFFDAVFADGPNKAGLVDLYRTISESEEEVHFLALDSTYQELMAEGTAPAMCSVLPDGTRLVLFAKDALVRELIGHELVHVWQDLRGDLKVANPTTMCWKGDEYPILLDGSEDYFKLPWEQEAYEFQATLVNEEQAKELRKAALLD